MIINITGIDGCGKSTQVKKLIQKLDKLGYEIYLSKAYGKEEKKVFEKLIPKFDQKAILFIFQALHVQQFNNAVEAEALKKIVVADRWDDSYLVYHSTNGVLSKKPKLREQINDLAFKKRKADLTFYLDVNVENIMHRLKIRGESFLEKKPAFFFETIRQAYLDLAALENWVIIDGTLSIKDISNLIFEEVNLLLKK